MRTSVPVLVSAVLLALVSGGTAFAVPVTISAAPGGAVHIAAGERLAAGYSFWIAGRHAATRISFASASISIAGRCSNGAPASVTVPLAEGPYNVAANDGGRQTIAASVLVPRSLCGGGVLTTGTASFAGDVQSTATADVRLEVRYGGASSAPVSVPAGSVRAAPRAPAQPLPPSSTSELRIATKQHRAAGRIEYRITVTNTSDVALAVALSDARCDSSSMSPSPVQTVLAGSSLAWDCSHVLRASDKGLYTNVAAAIGTARDGTQYGPVASRVTAGV